MSGLSIFLLEDLSVGHCLRPFSPLIATQAHHRGCDGAGYTPDSSGAKTESAGNDISDLILTNSCSAQFTYTGAGRVFCHAVLTHTTWLQ